MVNDILNICTNPAFGQILGSAMGVSLIGYSAYGLFNRDNSENKICDYKELKSLMGAGVMLSEHVRLSVQQSLEHILMIAPCGTGKSRRFIAQNINNLSNCSLVVTDPSGELEKMCSTNKKKYILNPFRDDSIGNNQLRYCRNEYEVRKLAQVMLTNGINAYSSSNNASNMQDLASMSQILLTAYMLMNYHTKQYKFSEMIKNICILPLESKVEKDENGNITKVSKSLGYDIALSKVDSAITEFKSFMQVVGSTGSLASIRTVLNTCLQLYLDSNVVKLSNKPNIDFSSLRKEESIIFIQIPEEDSDYFSPLVATFFTQLFDYLLKNDEGLTTYVLLDEMCNIGLIPSFNKIISTIRKHGVSIVGAIQSITQLSLQYGELQGKGLRELFQTIMICRGVKDSAEYVSNLLGTKDVLINNMTQTKTLITPDEIRRLNDDDILIVCKNKRPVIDKMMKKIV